MTSYFEFISFLKKYLFFISFLYFSLYLPFSILVYSGLGSGFVLDNTQNFGEFNILEAEKASANLVSFFWHRESLSQIWSEKEKFHMSEVRGIYDKMFFLTIFSTIFLILFFNKEKLILNSITNIKIIFGFLLLIPFFSFFWNKVFHKILFNNDLWLINSSQVSFYLFPIEYFIFCLVFIVFLGIFVNLSIFWSLKYGDSIKEKILIFKFK